MGSEKGQEQARFDEIVASLTWTGARGHSSEEWTSTPPTLPGWYWYYGPKGYKHTLQACQVFLGGADQHVVRIIDGGCFWYEQEHRGVSCWWQRMVPPGLGIEPVIEPVEKGT